MSSPALLYPNMIYDMIILYKTNKYRVSRAPELPRYSKSLMFTSSVGSGRSADLGQNSGNSHSRHSDSSHFPALVDLPLSLPADSFSSFSSTQQSRDTRVANNPGGYFSSIVEQHDAFAILKGRTDQDIGKYVHLSDEELTAIIKLRLFVRATGNCLHSFCSPKLGGRS